MMYTNPRPTFESLGTHYPDDYFCYEPAGPASAVEIPAIAASEGRSAVFVVRCYGSELVATGIGSFMSSPSSPNHPLPWK